MTQKNTQMKLARYLFTAVLALLFVSCSKGRSSNEPKPNNGEQTTSSKQAEEEIVLGQREVTLQVGETSKVTLRGVKNARVETSNSNLVEATLIEQETAVSLKGLQAGEGTVRVFSSNRYAEIRVVVKANVANPNNSSNGKDIVGDKVSPDNYELSADGLTLIKWKNTSTQNLDMNRDSQLRKITSIGEDAFRNFSSLKTVHIASSVTRIGSGAFEGCSSLTSVDIPSSVTSIESSAFNGCSSLTSINIPSSVTSIESSAFNGCSSLTSVTIPNSVTSIGNKAFYGCRGLTSINIPSSVKSIGSWAFDGCSGLTSVTIPSSVTSIGSWAFNGCGNLISINIPNSVRSIGESSFSFCRSLTNIIIPSSVTSIGERAFQGCSSLTSVNIPSSITSIGSSTFYECSRLTSVNIPSSIKSIESFAFSGCSRLTSVNIPSSVISIGGSAFKDCGRLASVVFKGNKPPTKYNPNAYPIFEGTPSNLKLIVPRGAKSAYRNAGYPEDKLIEE